jgi:site-specific recombinase XerD
VQNLHIADCLRVPGHSSTFYERPILSKETQDLPLDLLGDPFIEPVPAERQTVKRDQTTTVDAHERHHRDFLTQPEITRLLAAAKGGRFGVRDHAMLLLAFRHGLRVSELTTVRIADVDLDSAHIWVKRQKDGLSTTQPLQGDELRALRAYLRSRTDQLPWLFLSSRGSPMTRQNVNYLIDQAGERASLGHLHPHMLRHSCGHVLADQGTDTRLLQDWLGHRDIRHTAHYTRTSSKRFEGVWRQ